jgi:hypothetical protein
MLACIITSTPILETESPFIISCKALISNDPMNLQFIGNYARAMADIITGLRSGDVVSIGGKIRKGNILVESMTVLNEMKGRKFKVYA